MYHTLILTTKVKLRRWLSAYHPSEVSSTEEPLKAHQAGFSDVYAADVEGDDGWDISDLTGGEDLGHAVSIHIDYDQL